MTYPIAETFLSCQGEGLWTGTRMHFIRFAGCNVGYPFTKVDRQYLPVLQPYQEKCTDWAGNSFACDTNYRISKKMSVEEILKEVGDTERVCLTGGEPMMHNLEPLVKALESVRHKIHIETSGTKQVMDLYHWVHWSNLWLTVSPKQGYLIETVCSADELKILVDERFDEDGFCKLLKRCYLQHEYPDDGAILWFQPINDEHEIRQDNLQRCLELQKKYPFARISTQMHKIWRVR